MSTIIDINTNGYAPVRKNSIGIRGKLILGFTAIVFIFVLAVSIILVSINKTKNFSTQVATIQLPLYEKLVDLESLLSKSQLYTQDILLSNSVNNTRYKIEFSAIWNNIDKIQSYIDSLSQRSSGDLNLQQWNSLKLNINELKLVQEKIFSTIDTDKPSAYKLLESEAIPLMNKIFNLINNQDLTESVNNSLLDQYSHKLNLDSRNIISSLFHIQNIEFILLIIGVFSAVLIYKLTSHSIIRQINIFRQFSSKIASGDLTHSIVIENFDEIGHLGSDLNKMTMSLSSITKEITDSCHNIVTTLDEVQHAVDAQAAGASEQATSINEITSSLSEIEKCSTQTMEKAKFLGEAAERTQEKGKLGLDSIDQSVNEMKEVRDKVEMIAQTILELSNKTQQVGEITAVVNNLAQQSKMLALNASIEAAKAGESGKGFAVVAVEVKNLAEQSEHATSQVQKILEDIRHAAEKAVMVTEEGTKKVDEGTQLVEQTGDIIRNLNDVIHETMIASQQIESAVRQESAGIEQITIGMNEINQVTTSFVASVKQTTEAINNLSGIAKRLKSYTDTYKL